MKPTLYLETTVFGYLAGRLSRNPIIARDQEITREWWETKRHEFILIVSEEVLAEIGRGDPGAARERMEFARGLAVLPISVEAEELAQALIVQKIVPAEVSSDALHLATASLARADALVSWNLRHITNFAVLRKLRSHFETLVPPLAVPFICTPESLIGGYPT